MPPPKRSLAAMRAEAASISSVQQHSEVDSNYQYDDDDKKIMCVELPWCNSAQAGVGGGFVFLSSGVDRSLGGAPLVARFGRRNNIYSQGLVMNQSQHSQSNNNNHRNINHIHLSPWCVTRKMDSRHHGEERNMETCQSTEALQETKMAKTPRPPHSRPHAGT